MSAATRPGASKYVLITVAQAAEWLQHYKTQVIIILNQNEKIVVEDQGCG